MCLHQKLVSDTGKFEKSTFENMLEYTGNPISILSGNPGLVTANISHMMTSIII